LILLKPGDVMTTPKLVRMFLSARNARNLLGPKEVVGASLS
jgi:hypothetical protein